MSARKKFLTPPLKATARYARLEKERSSLCDHLQVLEMADGYAHMVKSGDYREYCALKTRCEKLHATIASAEIGQDDDILGIEAQELMRNASDEMLRLAPFRGEIDLNRLAQWELRSRR